MNEKAVIILSGGIDSSTLCYKYAVDNFDIYSLTINYGQRHSREVESAKIIAGNLGISHKVADLSPLKHLLYGSALTDPGVEVPRVPEKTEYFETLKSTIVPNRNAIFLSIAIGYAQSIGANSIFFGAHHSDRGVYPDCRKEFVEAFEIAERLANDNQNLKIEAPFVDMDKSEIVKLGSKLQVPFESTWTCYVGGELHCGNCSACNERKRAFTDSGIKDPTKYKN
ncbi:MAG: 7-cyano-7-deazaguanine synthase QueC [Thermodesulfobacteriota bacterium]